MYNVRLLDQGRRRIAVIEAPASWQYTRRPSEATNISVALPRTLVEDALPTGMDVHAFLSPAQVVYAAAAERPQHVPKHKHAQIGRFVEIYRGTQHVVTGRIVKTDITADIITIECFTEEILLETHVTPAQYGRVWDHWDLADVARDVLYGWHVMRVKDKSQWDEAIEAVNVDTTTEPGVVMLAKSGGRYVASGHITVRFKRDDVPNFVRWDRIRWASDNAAPVRTTMQYRYGDGTSMGAWSDEVEGALPDEIGVVPGTTNAEVIDVRINLYTDDRDTEDDEGNPVGQTPYVFAVEMVARTVGTLQEGDIPAVAGVKVTGLEADGVSAFNVLSQACAQTGWEFWVSDGKLNLAQEMGADRTSSVLLRAGTNISVQTLSTGDDELVNILTAYGPGSGINRLVTIRRHEESIAQYGEHHGIQVFEDVTTLDELIQAADKYLAEHATPVPAYHVQVHYPYGAEPEFGCGDYVRVVDPRNGIITCSRIVEEQREYSPAGLRTTLFLGVPAPDLARQVRPTPPPRAVAPPAKPEISVSPIAGGIRVVDTRAPKTKWLTTECHVSDQPDFERTAETLVENARKSRFDVLGLTPGVRYYAQLVRIDPNGNESVSEMRSAVAGDIPEPTPDLTPPAKPTGLAAIPVLRGFVLTWDRHQPPPPLDRYALQVSSRPEGGSWSAWSTVSDEIRSNHYSHEGLDPAREYRYRLRAISRAQVESDWSDTLIAGTPGKVSLAEDVVGRLARGALAQDVIDELDGIVTIESNLQALSDDVDELSGDVSAVVQTADQLSQTVAQVEDGLVQAQSTIQQHATEISQRLMVVDALGNPVTSAQIVMAHQDGQGNILVQADKILMEGSVGVRELSTLGGGTQVTNDGVKIIDGSTEVLRLGQVGGLPWGPDNSPLPARPGLWGDHGAGLYLRGYAALIDAGYADDEGEVRIPDTAVNPQIFVSAKEQVAYSPTHGVLTHQFIDAFLEEDAEGRFYRIKAKTMIRGQEYSWPSRANDRGSWTYTQPQTAHPNGNKGVFTDFIICRPSWWINWAGFGGYPISLRLEATNEFDANGDPINWKTLRTWSRAQPGEGTLNWDTSLESYGQWAIRVRGESANPALVTYATCGISKAGYRTGDEYLDVNGNKIIDADPASVPSGMSVLYLLLDKG